MAILFTLFYLLTGGTFLPHRVIVYLYLADATGLAHGSPVTVDGIGVGKVDTVLLSESHDPNRVVRVTMLIDRDRLTTITTDSTTEINSDSLIGDKFVDVQSGKSPDHVQVGGELKLKAQPELVTRVDLPEFRRQVDAINAVITDIEQGRGLVGQFVLSTDMYGGLLKTMGQLEHAFHQALASTAQVGGALYTDAMYRQIGQPFVDLERTLAMAQSGQGPAGHMLRDTADYDQWRSTLADLRKRVQALGASDFMTSDQMYRDLNRQVVSAILAVDQFNANPMLNSPAQYESWTGTVAELANSMKDFRGNPQKFLRLKVF